MQSTSLAKNIEQHRQLLRTIFLFYVHTFCSKAAAMAAIFVKWKAKVGSCNGLLQQFEQYIDLVRCQDDVLAAIEVAEYVQACGSAVLVVRTAGEHEKTHAETEIYFVCKPSTSSIGC